jgi:hypothetical protein
VDNEAYFNNNIYVNSHNIYVNLHNIYVNLHIIYVNTVIKILRRSLSLTSSSGRTPPEMILGRVSVPDEPSLFIYCMMFSTESTSAKSGITSVLIDFPCRSGRDTVPVLTGSSSVLVPSTDPEVKGTLTQPAKRDLVALSKLVSSASTMEASFGSLFAHQ